jgi:hypothetical protein
MLQYRTHTSGPPPALAALAGDAASALSVSPYGGQNHQDVYAGLGRSQAADLSSYARQAGDAYANAEQQAQQTAALAGLQSLAQAQQNNESLRTSRLQMLLGGLL